MKIKKPETRVVGFSMLELMAVVFIIGILAAVAIPLLNKYLLRSKASEASLNLRKIYDGEITYFNEEHTTQAGNVLTKQFVAAGPEPSGVPTKDKRMGNWDTDNWHSIKFGAESPVQYRYTVDTSGVGNSAAFTARAEGDIDGDGKTSMFERVGKVDAVSGEVTGGGAVYELDPIE